MGFCVLDPVICARLTFPVCHQFSVVQFYSALAARNCMSVRLPKVYNYFSSVSGCSKKLRGVSEEKSWINAASTCTLSRKMNLSVSFASDMCIPRLGNEGSLSLHGIATIM